MFPPCRILPATCELCGNWLPDHQASCPRNGVHPSQWSLAISSEHDHQMNLVLDHHDDNDLGVKIHITDSIVDLKEWN
ncbi:hypothetical protein [Absidia glauca]|uniref:Uncharacterized protein n=1 Tax=Absidia glauca TaxID=4829 RepID=A0A163LZE7_ABSGL|nr:hypothetical protein [Absidia glauca]